ncbi:helix-turn-helix domain-containing protein [Kitasatospora sp. GP82]|uniref:helix-turn-helix domain-containing protein n=1 Tax=Kitasatospora sp. GP82 TaxID=3035089 RepID=UPI0024739939|nr:helix-turn-helix domain-containing protein [Kitasatospora sp. GP82]
MKAALDQASAPGSPQPLPARYLEPEDIAEIFQVPLETVYQWRRKRTGPPGFRVGRHLRYDPTEVAQWVANQTREAA